MFPEIYDFAKFKVFGHTFVMLNVWLRKLFFNGLAILRIKLRKNTVVSSLSLSTCLLRNLSAFNQWFRIFVMVVDRCVYHLWKISLFFASFQEFKETLISYMLSRVQDSGTVGWLEDSSLIEHTLISYNSTWWLDGMCNLPRAVQKLFQGWNRASLTTVNLYSPGSVYWVLQVFLDLIFTLNFVNYCLVKCRQYCNFILYPSI